ncbi:unnamed protein product [Pieris macdunnoughi]|uniref:Uncharacterized protein n=1 Tax=Pieris macdunnoughi TaxID=345717 RepID=A0A821WNX9_9NEOP|nr:unnamed protein product [Pieris macdunnoughi]
MPAGFLLEAGAEQQSDVLPITRATGTGVRGARSRPRRAPAHPRPGLSIKVACTASSGSPSQKATGSGGSNGEPRVRDKPCGYEIRSDEVVLTSDIFYSQTISIL